MSSSEDSDDFDHEELKMILAAADSNFLQDSMFSSSSSSKEKNDVKQVKLADTDPLPKSQRFIDMGDDIKQSDQLKITPSMQAFFAKKLSEMIAKQIEFADVTENHYPRERKLKHKIRLLSDSNETVRYFDEYTDKSVIAKQNRPEIKRKIIEPDSLSAADKLNVAVTNIDEIQKETSNWKNSKKGDVFQYKEKANGILHFVEPQNEFTKMRKKNCWSEKYIARKNKAENKRNNRF